MHNEKATFEKFEQGVVFRLARILPLVFSTLAVLALVGATFAILYSVIPTSRPPDPAAPPDPVSFSVGRGDIDAYVTKLKSGTQSNTYKSTSKVAAVSSGAIALAEQMHRIRQRTDTLGLSWTDPYETVCTYRGSYSGECYSSERRRSGMGVSSAIELALKPYNNSEETENVTSSGIKYTVNPSRSETKLSILKELEGLLRDASATNVYPLVIGWALLRNEREEAREKERKRLADEVAETQAKVQAEYSSTLARKQQAMTFALTAGSGALGLLVLLGLVLAVLAIERHTRELQGLRETAGSSGSSARAMTAG
jgi:hypothetical protein